MPISQECRISPNSDLTIMELVYTLAGGKIEPMSVLFKWLDVDPMAVLGLLHGIDMKHLYDEHIWAVYELCNYSIERFIYHVQMELPDQATGELSVTGPYTTQVDMTDFARKRTFGTPGSYWALQDPPTAPDYSFPIR